VARLYDATGAGPIDARPPQGRRWHGGMEEARLRKRNKKEEAKVIMECVKKSKQNAIMNEK